MTISIDRDGRIYIDDAPVAAGGFASARRRSRRGGEDAAAVTLRADRALDYGRVMAVMGELNRAGLRRVALVTTAVDEAR